MNINDGSAVKRWFFLMMTLLMAACSPPTESETRRAETIQLMEMFFDELGHQQPNTRAEQREAWVKQMERLAESSFRGDSSAARQLSCFFLQIWRGGWGSEGTRERVLFRAYEWMRYAADKGNNAAMVDLYAIDEFDRYLDERYRKVYGERGLYTMLNKEEKTGEEMMCLALCYRDGIGVKKNRDSADDWYRRFLEFNSLPVTEEAMEQWRKGGSVLLSFPDIKH